MFKIRLFSLHLNGLSLSLSLCFVFSLSLFLSSLSLCLSVSLSLCLSVSLSLCLSVSLSLCLSVSLSGTTIRWQAKANATCFPRCCGRPPQQPRTCKGSKANPLRLKTPHPSLSLRMRDSPSVSEKVPKVPGHATKFLGSSELSRKDGASFRDGMLNFPGIQKTVKFRKSLHPTDLNPSQRYSSEPRACQYP